MSVSTRSKLLDYAKRAELKILGKHAITYCYNKPKTIQIETTALCNSHCIWCSRYLCENKKDMQLRHFANLLSQVGYAREIYPFGCGEPLLHPKFEKFITLASSHSDFVGISTNGLLLGEINTEKLNGSGLTELTVSIDSPNENEYERIRGISLSTVQENSRYFSSHSHIPLRIHAVLSSINIKSAIELPRMAKKLGAVRLTFNILHPTPKTTQYMPNPVETLKALNTLDQLCSDYGLTTNARAILNQSYTASCIDPLLTCFIDSEGYLTPCCNMPMHRLGNVFKEGFKSCWNSERTRRFRRSVLSGNLPKWCQTFCMKPRNLFAAHA